MGHGSKGKRTPRGRLGGLQVVCLSLGVFAAQVWVAPAAASSFRLAKETALVALFGVAAVLWLWEAKGRGELLLANSPFLWFVSAYPVILAVSALWAWNPWASLLAAGRAAVWVLAVFALSRLTDKGLVRVAAWAVVGAAVSAVTALIQAAGGSPFQLENAIGRGHVVGLAGNPNDIAMACLVAAPLLLVWRTGRAGTVVRVLILGVLVGAVVASQSRAGLIGLALEVVTALAVLLHKRASRKVLLAASLATAGILLVGLWTALPRFELAVSQRSTLGLLGASQRAAGWSAAASMIESRPLVGVGGDNYSCRFAPARLRWLVKRDETRSRGELRGHFATAHLDPLQVAAELGALGVLWMVGVLVAFARSRCWRDTSVGITVAGLLPLLLFHYPFHLAVVLAPLAIHAAWGVRRGEASRRELRLRRSGWVTWVGTAMVLAVVYLQVQTLRLNAWQKSTTTTLESLARMTDSGAISRTEQKAALLGIQRDALTQLSKVTGEAPYLWRVIGRCRLAAGDPQGAEIAFMKSLAECPHEEAYFGMGLAMVDQGQLNGGLPWLLDACRIDPDLSGLIPDQDLRSSVMGMLDIDGKAFPGTRWGSRSRGAGAP